MRRLAPQLPNLAVAALAVAAAALALAIVRRNPTESFAGDSVVAQLGELVAGCGLVAAALAHLASYRRRRFALLAAAAGVTWFVPEWSNPGVGSSLAFTAGLIGVAACAPLLAHAALAYPDRRLSPRLERPALGVAYAGALLALGLLPSLVFDPADEGCFECPRNLVAVHADPALYATLLRWGIRIALVWTGVLVLLLGRRAVLARAARAVVLPVLVPAAAYNGLLAVEFAHSFRSGVLTTAAFDRRVWSSEAIALVLFALGVAWGLVRLARARSTVAQLIVELSRAPTPGGVRDALAQALADPSLQLAYLREDGSAAVDARGRQVDLDVPDGRALTPLLRDGRRFAVLVHDAALLGDPDRVQEALSAARLAIDNEHYQATVRAQVEDLRRSQARIIDRGDAERRRLERDLHDGAQQRMLALSMALQLLHEHAGPARESRLSEAEAELQVAHAELREIAHGIYPAMLGAHGFAAAVEALSERAGVTIRRLPEDRLPPAVEAAAYFAVAEAAGSAASALGVEFDHAGDRLVGRLDGVSPDGTWLVDVSDRIGALGGRVDVQRDEDSIVLHVEIPCE
jgi:signal transduction histidine kinase